MNKQAIKELALSCGFKLKQQPDGSLDLNSYVYDFALALIFDAGREGYLAALNDNAGKFDPWYALSEAEETRLADQYAESLRKGGE